MLRQVYRLATAVVVASASATVSFAPASAAPPPNVIVILADDLGYADLGVQGGRDIPTPHIDALGKGGTRFTQGYVTCPVCAPTRAGLLTGRYQQRFGFDENGSVNQFANYGLDREQKTIADSFQAAGFATAIFGKWHEGETDGYLPNDRGFDEFLGILHGANDYLPFTDLLANANAWRTSGKAAGGTLRSTNQADPPKELLNGRRYPVFRQKARIAEPRHLSEAFSCEAVDFIGRQLAANKPFFLYLPFNAVHVPFAQDRRYDQRFTHLPAGRREYAALLASLDDGVGRVLAKLREKGAEANTLIVFLSDNGGPSDAGPGGLNYSSNLPLRGRKNQMYEGGIRVPFLVAWKNHLPAGQVIATPVISLDILPTALAAAGVQHVGSQPLDGKNLLPLIRGESREKPHNLLFWRMAGRFAARDSRWKTIRFEDGRVELYDLANDPAETTDVAAKFPHEVARLAKEIEAWDRGNEKPRWSTGVNYPTGRPAPPAGS